MLYDIVVLPSSLGVLLWVSPVSCYRVALQSGPYQEEQRSSSTTQEETETSFQ